MNLLKRIHKLFDRLVGATYYYVTIDICPDYSGQGEMCSYTVKANDASTATAKAQLLAMKEWGVEPEALYVVDYVQTKDDELIYNS